MYISAMEEYGLRCALQLAKAKNEKSDEETQPLSASQIAEKEGISVEYVSKFMHLFKKAALVTSVRGIQGGFILAGQPDTIPLKQVFESLRQKKEIVETEEVSGDAEFCSNYSGKNTSCVHLNECSVRPFWGLLTYYFEEVTRKLTLGDLLQEEFLAKQRVRSVIDENVANLTSSIVGV